MDIGEGLFIIIILMMIGLGGYFVLGFFDTSDIRIAKEGANDITGNVISAIELYTQNSSRFSCDSKLKDNLGTFKVGSDDIIVDVIEKEYFADKTSSIEYVQSWNVHNSIETVEILENMGDYSEIHIALVKEVRVTCDGIECPIEFTDVKLKFVVCDGGDIVIAGRG